MDRNTENHFSMLPTTEIGRSKFTRNFTHKTTFNTGDLFVIDWQEILPGDTVNMDMSSLVRLQTPITPVMDNLYLDTYWFFVPNRLLWTSWVNFMGENTNAWTQTNNYEVPQIRIGGGGTNTNYCKVDKGSIANYMGIPLGLGAVASNDADLEKKTLTVNALPFRAYCKIWNDWFRSTPTQKELYFPVGGSTVTYINKTYSDSQTDPYTQFCYRGAGCARVNKFHDVFTSCLPEPQEGGETLVPMVGNAPIMLRQFVDDYNGTDYYYGENIDEVYVGTYVNQTQGYIQSIGQYRYPSGTGETTPDTGNPDDVVTFLNTGRLEADLTKTAGATVAAIRTSFAIQRFYEKTARGGNRYIEQIKTHFNTTNPDYRLQRSEYLGGATRIPISINQVIQTNYSTTAPLGNAGAYSVTSDVSTDMWTSSFSEHGILMCVGCARTDHTYQQGISKKFFRKGIFDYYWPEFASISEQPVYEKEIFAADGSEANIAQNDTVFGFQEAWSEYRYEKDIITGELSSMYSTPLDIWHYGDYYTSAPTLNEEWMRETKANVNRTLAVQNQDQFLGDFYIRGTWTRPMPLYSIPGLIDHH